MATATSRGRAAAPASKAVVPARLSNDDLMALLGATGAVAQNTSEFHRITLKSGVLETDDGRSFFPREGEPSMTVRIVTPPKYYNGIYLDDSGKEGAVDASIIGRPELNGRFSRQWDSPEDQAADTNPANEVYEDLKRITGKRGSFKGDMEVQIVPPSGELTGEETIYALTLSTTSIFEWRGSSRDQIAGSVSEKNFMVQLAELAVTNAVEAGLDEDGQRQAVVDAVAALRYGGVIADVYLHRAQNDDKTNTWWVLSFVPTFIDPEPQVPALEAGTEATAGDDAPF